MSDGGKVQARARIVSASRSLFAERGFFATRVADIARRAGMSPANVYWHFESKESLLRSVLAEGFAALEELTRSATEDDGGYVGERVEALLSKTISVYDNHVEFAVILGSLMGHGGQELVRSLGFDMPAIGAHYHANLGRLFEEARREGVLSGGDPDLLVSFYFAFFNGLLITYAGLWPTIPRPALLGAARRLIGAREPTQT